MDMLDGIFSFVLLDTRDNSFLAARDAIGITPLYIGWGLDGKHKRYMKYFYEFELISFLFQGLFGYHLK